MLLDLRRAFAPARPQAETAEPSPLLRLIAGDYAQRVAALWPAPHVPYLEMPAQRRHLVHVVLDYAPPAPGLAEALSRARADAVARDYLGPMPPGFLKLLGRLGEVAWAGEDYFILIDLFGDENAALVLRQTPAVSVAGVRSLDALAKPLRAPALARHLEDPAKAALLSQAWAAIVAVRGAAAGERALQRWARASDTIALFDMAAAELAPHRFDPAPFPVHADLRRLGGAAALADAGRRFRNCMASYQDRAADGAIALYEWAGPPPAALSLARDGFFGWRLEEARGVENSVLEADARDALTDVLRSAGVRVGRSGRDLRELLHRAAGKSLTWIDESETDLTPFGL